MWNSEIWSSEPPSVEFPGKYRAFSEKSDRIQCKKNGLRVVFPITICVQIVLEFIAACVGIIPSEKHTLKLINRW